VDAGARARHASFPRSSCVCCNSLAGPRMEDRVTTTGVTRPVWCGGSDAGWFLSGWRSDSRWRSERRHSTSTRRRLSVDCVRFSDSPEHVGRAERLIFAVEVGLENHWILKIAHNATRTKFPGRTAFGVAFGMRGPVRSIYATLIAQFANDERLSDKRKDLLCPRCQTRTYLRHYWSSAG
jgi:hypothetical protein